jgi:predicted ATPase
VGELPSGTVTFLFTDIEGSTRLLHELGAEPYATMLAEHRQVLRDAFARHGGVEVDTQGDAFFVAFPTARGALAVAQEAQAALEIPVRMGVHTGTPLLTDEGYVGADVHRAARIAAAGHGRQVLVSASAAALLDGVALHDLGEHRLKDLSAPERIFQLGDAEFPPLKTLYQTNLPVPATAFLGREQELDEIARLLADADVRLLTLTGAGGSGKTRLALQAAAAAAGAYPDGVWCVLLAPLTDAEQIMPAAARALRGDGPLHEVVADRRLLLLLDNFEHLIEGAADVARLLAACPHVDVLITSRERLRVKGEHVYHVPVLARSEARAFFVDRARAVQSDFEPDELVDELCERLDDLPLALELAAARVTILSTRLLLERLGGRLDLLRGGRDAEIRQQTLRATIEWSYELLDPEEQRLLAALSVFSGGWSIDAAERVCDADLEVLQLLVDKSLIRRWGPDRFGMLETIRDFASERLEESGEREQLQQRLFEHLLAELPQWRELRSGTAEVVDRLGADFANYRAALSWALEADPARCVELAAGLGRFWVIRDPSEGDRWLTAAIERATELEPAVRAEALLWAASCRSLQDDATGIEEMFEESLALFREIGNLGRVGDALDRLAGAQAAAGKLEAARAAANESLALFEQLGEREGVMYILDKVAAIASQEGDRVGAREAVERALALAREFEDRWWEVGAVNNLAVWALEDGELDRAAELASEGLKIANELGDRRHLAEALCVLAALAAARGDGSSAGWYWGALDSIERERRWLAPATRLDFEARVRQVEGVDFTVAFETARYLSADEAVLAALKSIET